MPEIYLNTFTVISDDLEKTVSNFEEALEIANSYFSNHTNNDVYIRNDETGHYIFTRLAEEI